MSTTEIKRSTKDLQAIFDELSPKCDEIKMGYEKNKALIEQVLSGVEVEYHQCLVYVDFIIPLQESWNITKIEYNKIIEAIANFDEALKQHS